MRTDHQHEPVDPDVLRDMGYETRDVSISGVRVATFGFLSVFLFAAILVTLYFFIVGPGSHAPPGLDANRVLPATTNPVNPLIQDSVRAKTDIMTLRKTESAQLDSSGTNPDGSTHIPIEQAMDIVASGNYISTGQVVPAKNPTKLSAAGGASAQ